MIAALRPQLLVLALLVRLSLKPVFWYHFVTTTKGVFLIRSLNILGWIYIFKLTRALLVKLGTYRDDVRVKI
jgi:hypothetical protein